MPGGFSTWSQGKNTVSIWAQHTEKILRVVKLHLCVQLMDPWA